MLLSKKRKTMNKPHPLKVSTQKYNVTTSPDFFKSTNAGNEKRHNIKVNGVL